MSREGILDTKEIFCLHFVGAYGHGDLAKKNRAVLRQLKSLPFVLPQGLKKEEGFKILSYILEHENARLGLPKNSAASVRNADMMLGMFGFKRIFDDKIEGQPLFVIGGEKGAALALKEVKNCQNESLAWFVPNVSEKEVKEIYKANNLKFPMLEEKQKV